MKKNIFFFILIILVSSCENNKTELEGLWVGDLKSTSSGDSIWKRVSLEFKDDNVTTYIMEKESVFKEFEIRKFSFINKEIIIDNNISNKGIGARYPTSPFVIHYFSKDSLIIFEKYGRKSLYLEKRIFNFSF